ncbi:MAG: nucleotide exchange factor GrpE, partial [Candidatus Zixiibacteriota bacterium]
MGKKKQKNNEPTQATDESTSPVTEEPQAESSEAEASQPQLSEKSEEEKLRERVAELEDRLLRSLAEFDNYKKRTARMYEQMASAANDKVLIDLLDVVDNFERAL